MSFIDNPVVLPDGRVESCGNFHGAPVAAVADFLAISIADVGALSERRTDRLLDPTRSHGLPPFLAPDAGVNSGLMIAQYTQAAMVAENRRLAVPASTDTLPTSAMQEDHVSLGWSAARKLRVAVANLARILAVELIAGGVGPARCGARCARPPAPAPSAAAVARRRRRARARPVAGAAPGRRRARWSPTARSSPPPTPRWRRRCADTAGAARCRAIRAEVTRTCRPARCGSGLGDGELAVHALADVGRAVAEVRRPARLGLHRLGDDRRIGADRDEADDGVAARLGDRAVAEDGHALLARRRRR